MKRTIFLILIIINCITIFYFSNQVADISSGSSGRVVNFLAQILPNLRNMPEEERQIICSEILQPIVRKTAHFSIYTLLGFLTMNFALTFNKTTTQEGLYSWLFGTAYAITDEIHQLFIQGRSCEFRDVCIDSLGVLTGIIFALIIFEICRKIRNKYKSKKGEELEKV